LPLKSLLRNTVAVSAQFLGQLGTRERRQRGALTVLCYHRVLPKSRRQQYFDRQLVVTPEMFDLHCHVLAKRFEVVPLHTALANWQQGSTSGKPLAAITFDDGYRDNETYAAPILRRYGLKATFYVVAGLVGTNEQPWYDRAGQALMYSGKDAPVEINKAKDMSPSERHTWLRALEAEVPSKQLHDDDLIMDEGALRRLVAAGHEIGSHTVTHPLLDQLDVTRLEDEVQRSKAMLEAASGSKLSGFCYPNGNMTTAVKAAVAKAGYVYAVSANPGINRRGNVDRLAVKRWFISQDRLLTPWGTPSSALFRAEVTGLAQQVFRRGGTS